MKSSSNASHRQVGRFEWDLIKGITLPETASFDLVDWTGDTFSPVLTHLFTPGLAEVVRKITNETANIMSFLKEYTDLFPEGI